MLLDIFTDTEPEHVIEVIADKAILNAIAVKQAGVAALRSLLRLPIDEQRAALPQMEIDVASEESRLNAIDWKDTEVKKYTTVEACTELRRQDNEGVFFHCLIEAEEIPEGAYDFKSAPDYMKFNDEPLHTYGAVLRELPTEEQIKIKDIDA
jgi:hypothetical protein